jgi:thiamine biosynthesis lipoprotein
VPASTIQINREQSHFRGRFVAMANPCEVLCETQDEALAREISEIAAREALRIEHKFSRYRSDGVVHSINTAKGSATELDPESAQLLEFAATLWQVTQGAFDITSGVLRHAWRFNDEKRVPMQADIDELMKRVGWQQVTWKKPLLTMPEGMEIDFGGIGKEYAVDRVVAQLGAHANIPMLVNFGGDLRTVGPVPVNGSWQVGIESIAAQGQVDTRIQLSTGALATSGDTRRFIEIDGRRYGHIIDARTGWPALGAPRSVTVAADTCSQAGTFSTLAMLQGENAERFLEAEGLRYWCLR